MREKNSKPHKKEKQISEEKNLMHISELQSHPTPKEIKQSTVRESDARPKHALYS